MRINPRMTGSDAPIARPRPTSAIRFKGDEDALSMADYEALLELGITPAQVVGMSKTDVLEALAELDEPEPEPGPDRDEIIARARELTAGRHDADDVDDDDD